LALLLALGTSAALTIDYLSSNPAFCGGTSGCGAVRRSGWGYLGVVPLPALGLLAFAATLGLSLGPPALRRFSAYAAAFGALIGAALIAVQALVVQRFCSLCMVVDGSAIVAGAAAVALLARPSADPAAIPDGPLRAWAWSALGALAVVAPLVWPSVRPAAALPAGVRERHVAGKINVVEFADFECPFCRRLHSELTRIIDDYPGKVNFVRLHMPLQSHEHARPAARAAVCASQQGHEQPMADFLFTAESLEQKALLEGAERLNLDMGRFKRCLEDPATDKTIDAQASILRDAGFKGLPTTYVGAEKIVGAQPEEVFRDAFDQATRGEGSEGIPGWLYWPFVLIIAAATLWFGRFRGAPAPSASPS